MKRLTPAQTEAMRRLLPLLQTMAELRRDRAAQLVETSGACICKCFALLSRAGMVQEVRRELSAVNHPTKPVYRLSADAGKVAAFLAALDPVKPIQVFPSPRVRIPAPDPYALPLGFFHPRAA